MDKINNWYKLTKQSKQKQLKDLNFNKHYILPQSHVLCIGGTGSGKTTALLDFIKRSEGKFYQIIIFSGSTTEEPLYQLLKDKIPEVEMYNDINELPALKSFENTDKSQEKLIVFDDFITLKPNEMKKIIEYFVASRKYGFSCWAMAQNYVSTPKAITRNINIFIIFKINDTVSIRNIMKNHILDDDKTPEEIKRMYNISTAQPLNFFMIDLKSDKSKRYRHLFLNFF